MELINFFSYELLLSTLRVSSPLIFAAIAGLISERSGTIQIGLEGFMLVGAFVGATIGHYTQSSYIGAIAAITIGSIMGLIYSLFTTIFKADQIVTGTAFNLLVMGLIPFLSKFIFNSTGSTPALEIQNRFSFEPIAFAFILVFFIHWFLNHTRPGYWIQFSGEHPESLTSVGIKITKVKIFSLMACGSIAGMGGASLSLFLSSSYSPLMTSGRGFIALSALILGKWKPIPTLLACLLMGYLEAIQIRLQGIELAGTKVPVQFIQILPYILTIFILAGAFGRTKSPSALGK